MALVKYIKDNIPETTIGFLTDDSSFRDYLINIVPVMFMFNSDFFKKIVEFQDKGENNFNILITDTQNDMLIKTLNRKFSIVTYKNKNITFIPKNEEQEIEIKNVEEDILDLLEGEVFYNIFMGFEKRKNKVSNAEEDSFEKLYSVPERPLQFVKEGNGGKISDLVGWTPFHPYLKKEDIPDFKSGHWGQRKLLLTEILFFTLHGKPNTTVIYAGAAPSDHMLFLSKMFKSYHFVLVDPERWNKDFGKVHAQLNYSNFPEYQDGNLVMIKRSPEDNINYIGPYKIIGKERNGSFNLELVSNKSVKRGIFVTDMKPYGDFKFVEPLYYKINDNIDVYHGYFTDNLAVKLGKQYANTNVLFVSDIRPTNIEGVSSTLEERDNIVIQNMEMQKRWYNLINSERRKVRMGGVWAMFKFKATFGIPTSKYLKGDLYYQPWAPLKSPELRLITNSEETREYSNDWLEQHLTWFNEVRRNTLKEPRDERLNGVFDTQFEYDIMKMYVDKFKPKDTDIYNWMGEISAELGDRDRNKDGLFQFEADYETDEWRKKKWIDSLLTKMQKYTPEVKKGY
jgi:hypothetical protein